MEIVEPETRMLTPMEKEIDRQVKCALTLQRGGSPPRGQATIIQGIGKCKRLHFDHARIGIGVAAVVAVGFGAGHAYGMDAGILAVGLVLAASTWSR
jgi:hypothetical protein